MSEQPPPDWYPDPELHGQLRYWDGNAWTEHRAPDPTVETQPEEAPPPGVTELKGWHGKVRFDGDSVTISKTLKGETTIPVNAINAVTIERAGVGIRAIRFSIGGGTEAKQSKVMGDFKDAQSDPYALTFMGRSLPRFEALAEEILKARFGA